MVAFWAGELFGADWISSLGIIAMLVIWIPAYVYVYLGVRLTEYIGISFEDDLSADLQVFRRADFHLDVKF